ncbi:MAG TPA: response regulator [Chthoniobacterales bacterium]
MKNASLFVVDDDPGVLRLVKTALERAGFPVAAAASGMAALEWLGEHRADLLLLDLKLLDLEAREVIARLEEQGRLPAFMIITGQGDERVAVEMMQRGAIDYVVKDGDFLEFLPARVTRALEQIEKDRRLEQLEREVLQISEAEQRRIGQDLHDSICQRLIGIELQCHRLEQRIGRRSKMFAVQMAEISRHVREVAAQTRSLAHGLSPLVMGAEGLTDALREFAENTGSMFRVTCRFENPTPLTLEDFGAATHLYRIVQEAVTNAIRHGKATSIEIRIDEGPDGICLRISDDGRGFGQPTPDKFGMGLRIMQYRANQISADLSVASLSVGGVVVTCTMPRKSHASLFSP